MYIIVIKTCKTALKETNYSTFVGKVKNSTNLIFVSRYN